MLSVFLVMGKDFEEHFTIFMIRLSMQSKQKQNYDKHKKVMPPCVSEGDHVMLHVLAWQSNRI